MLSRRQFLEVAAAAVAVTGLSGRLGRGLAQPAVRQEDLLRFDPRGQVTLLHISDCHAQLKPIYYREPATNLGVGEGRDQAPHLTTEDFMAAFGIAPGTPAAYALTAADFEALARTYGKVGGMDRLATLIKAIRAERGEDRVLLLDGGDALQGSYTALANKGADMIEALEFLGVEATTGHWEFTLGAERVRQLFGNSSAAGEATTRFLAANIADSDFDEPVFKAAHTFEKGGVRIAVIGQAFPYTPIANPRWMIPHWSFGIREDEVRRQVRAARAGGAGLVVLLSHNGFDVDRKLAGRVDGIDVILTAHTHDALPRPVRVGDTLLIASGSHGKFLSRLDLEIANGRVTDFNYALIPVLADAIVPDADMAQLVEDVRRPHAAMLETELARTESLLTRRGNFAGSLDDLICAAMLAERDAEIALSPGFRWGGSLLAGQAITWDDVYNATAITYPACYRIAIKGEMIKTILEDVADNLFNPDPYYRQGGDMVRVGGLSFLIDIDRTTGTRISNLTLTRTGERLEPGRDYIVAGWASVNQATTGPPVWDVVAQHLARHKTVRAAPTGAVKVVRSGT